MEYMDQIRNKITVFIIKETVIPDNSEFYYSVNFDEIPFIYPTKEAAQRKVEKFDKEQQDELKRNPDRKWTKTFEVIECCLEVK